jgi:hypothetical protein
MKVVCVYLHPISGLTYGKTYDILQQIENSAPAVYHIMDDFNQLRWWSSDYLIPLEKYREMKLKELGI